MKQFIMIFICLGLIFFSFSPAYAAARTFTQDYTYKAGPLDNEFTSRVIAKAEAKNLILDTIAETAGNRQKAEGIRTSVTYNSDTFREQAENMLKANHLPNITTYNVAMLSCMTKIDTVKEKWDNRSFYYKARVKTNIDNVLIDFGKIRNNKLPTGDILANRAAATEELQKIKRINANLDSSSDQKSRQEIYNQAVNRLHATDLFEAARFLVFAGDSQKAIDKYTKAIEYDPTMGIAYHNRGALYLGFKKDKQLAGADFFKANQLYFNKAVDHRKAKNYMGCVANLDGALLLNPKDADAYFQRAYCNLGLGLQDKTKEDFQKAAKLGHKKAQELLTAKGIEW
jgi:tetratricopeptide (TPR) repeat protein